MNGFAARNRWRVAWAALVLALAGCWGWTREAGPIVFIVVDTMRADHVTCYGYPRPTTPNLCQLGADGVRFARAYAPRTNTTPSIATMLTGRYPFRHGIRDLYSVLPPESVTLAERLRDAGYHTGAFVSSFVMVRDFSGFDQGFEIYDDYVRTKEPFRDNYERHAKFTVNRALHWLETAGPHAFLFVHLIEPHGPYTPPPEQEAEFALPAEGRKIPPAAMPPYQRIPGLEYVNQFVGRYDGEIASADQEIGRLIGRLRERGWYRQATIMVLADHGESMGEDGIWFAHGGGLSEAETHVPLFVKFAAGSSAPPPGAVVNEPVSSVDVFRTLLAAAGVREDGNDIATGVDLREVALGAPRKRPPPITETPVGAGLALIAHGRTCTVHWLIPWSVMTPERVLLDPAAAARWPALAVDFARDPPDGSEACANELVQAVAPLITDLLTYKIAVPIVRRTDMSAHGQRGVFIGQRSDPFVPLNENEREALRKLGYLE